MRPVVWCIMLVLLIPVSGVGQEVSGIEIGTRVGLNIAIKGSELVTVGIPGGSPNPLGLLAGGTSSLHAAFFPWSKIMVEPQVNVDIVHLSNGDSETVTSFNISSQVVYLVHGSLRNSPYFGLTSSALFVDTEDASENDFAFGPSIGYRVLIGERFVLRPEASYRYWLDFEVEEITAAVALSILLK